MGECLDYSQLGETLREVHRLLGRESQGEDPIDAGLREAELLLGHQGLPADEEAPLPLGQQLLDLRIALQERDLQLFQLRGHAAAQAEQLAGLQREQGGRAAELSRRLAALQQAGDPRERALSALQSQLAEYQGLGPAEALSLRQALAASDSERRQLSSRVAALEGEVGAQEQRTADALSCWERVRGELQREAADLGAALLQAEAGARAARQDREVLAAKLAMLEGLSEGAARPLRASPGASPSPREEALLERLRVQEATSRKYKEAVRALKRRLAEAEEAAAPADAAAAELRGRAEQAEANQELLVAETAAAVGKLERQLDEARREAAARAKEAADLRPRLTEAEAEGGQWRRRALDAEGRGVAASQAAEASCAAAVRLAQGQAAQAESRAAAAEAQAKAASLQVLKLEKEAQRWRVELGDARSTAAVAEREREEGAAGRLAELEAALQRAKSQLATEESRHRAAEERWEAQAAGHAASLADANSRFRRLQTIMERLTTAGKAGAAAAPGNA